jgi:glycine/D-amino acid oxidase-like deaminating enzyme
MNETADVVVVGGGVLGLAVAWELTERRLKVVLLETGTLGSGVTGTSFHWINASNKFEDESYHRFNAAGVQLYEELVATWGAETLGFVGGGWLSWCDPEDEMGRSRLNAMQSRLSGWDYSLKTVDATDMAELEPGLTFVPGSAGLYAPEEGWVDSARLLAFMDRRVRIGRGHIRSNCPATGFKHRADGRVEAVITPEGPVATDSVVLAAGCDTPRLVGLVTGDAARAQTFPLRRVPGLLLEVAPIAGEHPPRRILEPPDPHRLHLRMTLGGGVLAGADDGDAAATESGAIPARAAVSVLRRISRLLYGWRPGQQLPPWRGRVGVRPIPADGLPLVGPLPAVEGVYVAVSHSGVTLAPLIARLLADHIVAGCAPQALVPYRLERAVYQTDAMTG